uniref:Uncharacterized protein n=1 Tax=Corethron hystrix TaxID=216773 RepID=A0A6U5KTY9_9STRA|mmetsp:Transcript_41690/g.97580  ORF Transcript_41690/g.97580 Transcript_41690/m.97580 type:complete len:112 (+) Transcript_41690:124-459(+)|eukprot:CAMPEP_0113308862 /NCGR_PEP_ID=MMETSP0010_2-20120614/7144_1 /TAXON_ID=216773 ORGANISM="Corethron hystrix, Strain 308" /NCGR_SAMPLE_ID=MMETSP0010_2 /ASSEMBLY_ACC=CAM_ASM_000155 /LENGTH=111 /DNA_ID=CAMNT_0000164015 /DNA_START=70 /DNA_END=405 /DNA_ORIENTATION=- /assembly_acc=CAM_ASM_000155
MSFFSFCSPGSQESVKTRGIEILASEDSTPSAAASQTSESCSIDDHFELTQEETPELVATVSIDNQLEVTKEEKNKDVPPTELIPFSLQEKDIFTAVVGLAASAAVLISFR